MPNWKKLIVSGSDASLNSLAVATNVTAQSFTGSLFGTSSWSLNANTASYVLQAVSASFATSASYALSSSYALNATSGSGVVGGTTNYLTVWKTNTALSRSAFYQDPNNNNYIGLFDNAPSYSLDVNGTIRAQNDLRGQQKVYFPGLAEGSPSTEVVIWDSAVGQLYRTGSSGLSVGSASFATSASRAISSATASSADSFTVRNNLFVPSISDQRVLYKSGSAVTGSSDFIWDNDSKQLTINGSSINSVAINAGSNTLNIDTNFEGIYLGDGTFDGVEGLFCSQGDQKIAVIGIPSNIYQYSDGNYKFNGNVSIHQFTGSVAISSSLYSAQGASAGIGTTTIVSLATGSYKAGFFDYVVSSGGNARAGTIMSVWDGSSVQYTDNSTLDIGVTTAISMSVSLSGGNALLSAAVSADTWNVKTTYRLI